MIQIAAVPGDRCGSFLRMKELPRQMPGQLLCRFWKLRIGVSGIGLAGFKSIAQVNDDGRVLHLPCVHYDE